MVVGCEYLLELHIQIQEARSSVFILTNSDFRLEAELIYSCTVICTTKQPGWPFYWDCAHCCNLQCSSFLFKGNCICSQKQVAKFISVSKFSLHLRAEPATVKVGVPARGRYFGNFWVGMCRLDPGTLSLY